MHHSSFIGDEHKIEHETADNLLDYLRLVFHSDIGEGHLENFESAQGIDFNFLKSISIDPIFPFFMIADHKSGEIKCEKLSNILFLIDPYPDQPDKSTLAKRGPPSIS